mgnify:CR=1 FL=1
MKIVGKLITEVEVNHKDLGKALKRAIFIELDLPRYNPVHHDGISFIEPVKLASKEDIKVFEALNTVKEFLDNV